MISLSERIKQLYLCHKLGGNDMFILSGILNIVAALLFIWWSFGVINSIFLLIPAVVFIIVGILSIVKAVKK